MHLNHNAGLPKVWLGKVLETLKFLLTLYANNITFFKTLCHFSYPHTCWMLYITSIRKKKKTKIVILTKECAQTAGCRKNITFIRDGCRSCM